MVLKNEYRTQVKRSDLHEWRSHAGDTREGEEREREGSRRRGGGGGAAQETARSRFQFSRLLSLPLV